MSPVSGPSPLSTYRARRRTWPSWTLLTAACLGVGAGVVFFVADAGWLPASAAFAFVLLVGSTLIFWQRLLDVQLTRRLGTGFPSYLSSFDIGTIAALLIGSIVTGSLLALTIAGI